MFGHGVDKDEAKAVEWYTKAAEQGDKDAQYALALCYQNGTGIAKDEAQAKDWLTKAVEQGHEPAKEALEKMNQ